MTTQLDRTKGLYQRDTDPQYPWAALGDSFAAGPGAGTAYDEYPDEDDCFRNLGAYPPQLSNDFPFPGNKMQFLACTGDVVDNLVDTRLPLMDPDQQFVTLSIGGNDMKFSKVLKACIFKPGGPASDDCDKTIDEAQEIIDNDLEEKLLKAYEAVFDRLTSDSRRVVFVQMYPSFFTYDTDWCNEQTLGIFPGYKPKLTRDLRQKLNQLAGSLRNVIKRTIEARIRRPPWLRHQIWIMDDVDTWTYEGHRFCEEGKETFDDEDIWFFTIGGNDSPKDASDSAATQTLAANISETYDASSCKDDPRADLDGAFGWGCDFARYIEAEDISPDTQMVLPESFVKAFHPKTAAFASIAGHHKTSIARHASPGSQDAEDGTLSCHVQHEDGDEEYYFDRDTAVKAIEDWCASTHSAGVGLGLTESAGDGGIIISATKDDDADDDDCPSVDVTSDDFVDDCESALHVPLDNCDLKKRSSDAWKQGGLFKRDCVTWSIGLQSRFSRQTSAIMNITSSDS